jgi:hypothetical protein
MAAAACCSDWDAGRRDAARRDVLRPLERLARAVLSDAGRPAAAGLRECRPRPGGPTAGRALRELLAPPERRRWADQDGPAAPIPFRLPAS